MKRKDPPVSKHSYLRYLQSGPVPTRFSFSPPEKPKRKAPIYDSAARETRKSRVRFDKVKLNSQSNPLDNLAILESFYISYEDYGFRSVPTNEAEAVKSKEELLMEQLKEKEEEVRRLNERLEAQRKGLEEELTEKMKQLELPTKSLSH